MGFKVKRYEAGLEAQDVANVLGVSVQTVYNWEGGRYNPEASKLLKIAEMYGCTVEELLRPDVPPACVEATVSG